MPEDWKDYLPEDAKRLLEELLDKTKKHRCAYTQSRDVKVAQLWSALVELTKEVREVKQMLGKMEEPFKAIIEVGEKEKEKTIRRIVEEIVKPVDKETREATQKLVDSLMKF